MAIHWTGGGTNGEPGSGDWNTSSNWSSGKVPKAGENVVLGGNDQSAPYRVTLDTSTKELNSISIGGSGGLVTLDIKTGGTLNVANTVLLGSNALIAMDGGEIRASAIDLAQTTSTVSGSGVLLVSNYTGTGTIEAKDGQLTVDGTVGSEIQLKIGGGSDLQLNGQVALPGAHGTLSFAGPDGTLDLTGEGRGSGGEPTKFDDTVKGFAAGDKIEVAGQAGDTLSYNTGSHELIVENSAGKVEEVIHLSGKYSDGEFEISTASGVDTISISCFMAGTLIATPNGNVAVEALKRGDLVLTTDGRAVPVGWIGRQTVSTVFGDPLRVLPIRIKAGAISENVPSRDLLLSPDHAVLVDGALIQVGALVNGTSVVQEEDVPHTFTYYHIEVDDHALILAENTPAETFVDNVERLGFDNWPEYQALYPEGKSITELPYPRAKAYRQVPVNIRLRLAERSQAIGAAVGGAAVA